ncbi:MAG: hypothetical protein IJT02_02355 [Synergistaceae bacterium]|nr:hypothetical protein [Synergistaceae bacterium]
MKRKILLAAAAVMLLCSSSIAEDYDISGGWNLAGTGFVEKEFLRVSLELEGDMHLTTSTTQEVLDNAASRDLVRQEYPDSPDILSGDLKFLTAYEIDLKITATELDIKAWSDHLPNYIRIPVPLPEMRPSNSHPYELPVYAYNDGLTYRVTLTSTTSGKVRITGYVDLDVVGKTELNSDCTVWKYGTQRPTLEEETDSGCNSGFGALMMLLLLAGVRGIVRD